MHERDDILLSIIIVLLVLIFIWIITTIVLHKMGIQCLKAEKEENEEDQYKRIIKIDDEAHIDYSCEIVQPEIKKPTKENPFADNKYTTYIKLIFSPCEVIQVVFGFQIRLPAFQISLSRFRIPFPPGLQIPLPGFQISLLGFRISIPGFQISLLGFRISLLGFRISLLGFRIPLPGFQISFLGFRIPLHEFQISLTEFWILKLIKGRIPNSRLPHNGAIIL